MISCQNQCHLVLILPNTSDLYFNRVRTDPQFNTTNNNDISNKNPCEDSGYDTDANFIAAEAVDYSLTFDEANYVGQIEFGITLASSMKSKKENFFVSCFCFFFSFSF